MKKDSKFESSPTPSPLPQKKGGKNLLHICCTCKEFSKELTKRGLVTPYCNKRKRFLVGTLPSTDCFTPKPPSSYEKEKDGKERRSLL